MARLLLFHHDVIQWHILTLLLQQDRHELWSCRNRHELKQFVNHGQRIEGIILDLDVIQFNWWILWDERKNSVRRHKHIVPILGLSTHYAGTESRQICEEFHVDAFLSLPVKPQYFLQSVRTLCHADFECHS